MPHIVLQKPAYVMHPGRPDPPYVLPSAAATPAAARNSTYGALGLTGYCNLTGQVSGQLATLKDVLPDIATSQMFLLLA